MECRFYELFGNIGANLLFNENVFGYKLNYVAVASSPIP